MESGSITALTGPKGSGKSTFGLILNGDCILRRGSISRISNSGYITPKHLFNGTCHGHDVANSPQFPYVFHDTIRYIYH